jgi:ABC-2 type transport system ATP-binding protein
MTPVIELQNVHKSFAKKPVLTGVNLAVAPGETFAFLGRNGAGKTTTIRLLMGLLQPDSGTIRVLGLDPRTQALAIRRQVGYLAEDPEMWGWMKIQEILRFTAPFYPTWDWGHARDLLARFDLPAQQKIKTLSKGQTVRLGLLLALAHRPKLVILDDPALGLDPIMRKEFLREIVTHLQGNDVAVFFSSHLLYEVEPVADKVGILDAGRILRAAPTEDLREHVRLLSLPRNASSLLPQIPGILDIRRDPTTLSVIVEDIAAARLALAHENIPLEDSPLNLDEIFEAYVIGNRPRTEPAALATSS